MEMTIRKVLVREKLSSDKLPTSRVMTFLTFSRRLISPDWQANQLIGRQPSHAIARQNHPNLVFTPSM